MNEGRAMTQATDRIDLKEKLTLFDELWTPKLVAKVNETDIRLSKIQGTEPDSVCLRAPARRPPYFPS